MGFWGSFGKIIMGKPVYDETSVADTLYPQPQESTATSSSPKSAFVDEHGNKIVPEITFTHFKSHRDGTRVKTWAWVANNSPFDVEIVKVNLLRQQQDIHRRLRPGEGHEVVVYAGSPLASDHDHQARAYYKIQRNDDYFLAEYSIEYNRESDGTYSIEEFHRTYQPRDI